MTRAFQKVYTKIDNITKATITLRATGVGNDELATVGGKLAQVVKIMGQNVTEEVANQTGMPKGVYVTSMENNSPAFFSGIKNGDILVKYNNTVIDGMTKYTECVRNTTPGAVVNLTIMRMSSEGYREFEFKVVTED